MYPKFIELHLADDDCLVSFNVENIVGFANTDNNGAGYAIRTSDKGGWYVKESYDEVKKLITDCGCLIHKEDPRLDITHQLTMDDLKRMIGEPVWNSNDRCWMLVSEDRGMAVYMLYNAGNGADWDEDMLIHFPLYRMRKA